MYTETSLLELLKQEEFFINKVNSWSCYIKRNEEKLKSSKTDKDRSWYNDLIKYNTQCRDEAANNLQGIRDQIRTYLKEVIQV